MRVGTKSWDCQLSIRFSSEQEQRIRMLAKQNGRSFNKEVIRLVDAQLALESKKELLETTPQERQKDVN